MGRIAALVLAGLILILLGLAYGPGALQTAPFHPAPVDPAVSALFEETVTPASSEGGLPGAEDAEPGPDGRLYVSLRDGRVMARAPEGGWSEVVNTGGRPLGLAFDAQGRLLVADALEGLLRFEPDGSRTVIEPAGPPPGLVFTDDLTVLEDGSIILSDASQRHGYGRHMMSFIEAEHTGRVLRYGPGGEREVVLDGFAFSNGITHDPATGIVYINETLAARVHAWNPSTGEISVLIDGLPGYPDNNHWDTACGCLWVALAGQRETDLERLHGQPFLKRIAWRVFQVIGLPEPTPPSLMALAVSPEGEPVAAINGAPDGEGLGVSGVAPWQGMIWTVGLERETAESWVMPDGVR